MATAAEMHLRAALNENRAWQPGSIVVSYAFILGAGTQ
jgi:hypothetical protein